MDTLEPSLTADEAMDRERFLRTFAIDMIVQSGDGSLVWALQLLSAGQQHSLEEEEEAEAAEFFDRASEDDDGQDDDVAYQSDPESGYPTEETVIQNQPGQQLNTVVILNDMAQRQGVDLDTMVHLVAYGEEEAYGGDDGGALIVPASGAAVAGLEKQAFHATAEVCDGCECGGVTGCAICLEDFEDGEEVNVMPCSGGHEFHPGCITEWLGQSNTCPLCRHALPTDLDDDGPYHS